MTRRILDLAGLILGVVVLFALVVMAFGLPLGPALSSVAQGAFGSQSGWARTFVKTTPMLLCGLGVVVALRAGLFNIGGEGQFVMGGLFGAAWFHCLPNLAPPLINAGVLGCACIGGALYSALAGWLQVRRNVPVVISTILLNFIAIQFLDWSVNGPLQESKHQLPLTERLPDAAMMGRFSLENDLHRGVVFAFLVAPLVAVAILRTRWGFWVRVVGQNFNVARVQKQKPELRQLSAMAMSGALCGLAGGIEYAGLAGQIGNSFAAGWGFLAIPVALLGGIHPLGVAVSAVLFGALFAGCENLSRTMSGGTPMVYVVQALAVLGFLAMQRRISTREAP